MLSVDFCQRNFIWRTSTTTSRIPATSSHEQLQASTTMILLVSSVRASTYVSGFRRKCTIVDRRVVSSKIHIAVVGGAGRERPV